MLRPARSTKREMLNLLKIPDCLVFTVYVEHSMLCVFAFNVAFL